jgi:protein subunit release factor B
MDAEWIPLEVRQRLQTLQANRINKDGVLSLSSQEYRTQIQNRKAVLSKLESLILEAWSRPKIRNQRTGVSKAGKARNKVDKKRRSDVKNSRRGSVNDGW